MLVIKDADDLLKYLETRREMIARQSITASSVRQAELADTHQKGAIYAFDEAIKAVQALIRYEDETPLADSGVVPIDRMPENDRERGCCRACGGTGGDGHGEPCGVCAGSGYGP